MIIISEIVHVFFIRENSLVNLNLHHFLAGREDSICRYCLGTFTSFHFTFDVVVHFFSVQFSNKLILFDVLEM